MSKLKIAIIGLGASGAFAARAAYDMGNDVEIYATQNGKMSPGATWLHWLPEDMSQQVAPANIYVIGKGTGSSYSRLQWGQVFPSSFPKEPVWEKGYDPEVVLAKLVPSSCNVNFVPFPLSDADIRDLSTGFDLVFQTFPTRESKEQQPALVPFVAAAQFGNANPDVNYVVYNGTGKGIVVREAQLFGNKFLEFPKNMTLEEVYGLHPVETGWQYTVLKDIHPNTKPWSHSDPKIKLVGRFAEWDRRVLSHDAYARVQTIIQEAEREQA